MGMLLDFYFNVNLNFYEIIQDLEFFCTQSFLECSAWLFVLVFIFHVNDFHQMSGDLWLSVHI